MMEEPLPSYFLTPHPGPLPVEGRGGALPAFGELSASFRVPGVLATMDGGSVANLSRQPFPDARFFSLSPQRGEGPGEGWDTLSAFQTLPAHRLSLPNHSQSPNPIIH